MAMTQLRAESVRRNVIPFTARPRPLRDDVPPFDPMNDAHLRAWESMWDFSRIADEPKTRRAIEANIEAEIALLDTIDGDTDLELDDDDRCEAYDDCPRSLGCFDGLDLGAGDPDDAEDGGDFEMDHCDEPCLIYGVYQGSNGMGLDCELRAGDSFECSSIA